MHSNNFYITSPIFYVNDVPHIGHAYTSIACDVIARFMRLAGKNVKYLTGTDEHGQKVAQSAQKAGLSPQAFVDKNAQVFYKMTQDLNLSNDIFIRTTDNAHKKAVAALWQKLLDNDNIYLGKYSGWYSIRDEAYYAKEELTEDGLAPTGATVEWVEEESYFFALSKWGDKLLEFYDQNPHFIYPESRRNEVISFVKNGLVDLSISRTSFQWGIAVPSDPKHVIYVWLDALTNYISALGYPDLDKDFSDFWPADMHIVGKDILRFHAIYWPAFLMAADLPLPKTIVAHGWWMNEGQKISKSIGNVINPFELVEEFGLDQIRYFLMSEITFGNDGNFARDQLIARNNSELVNKIGNLLQRTCTFAYKNCAQSIPNIPDIDIEEIYNEQIMQKLHFLIEDNMLQMQNTQINKVIRNILSITDQANVHITKLEPWTLIKTDPQQMRKTIYLLLEILRYIGIMLQPFIPHSADQMLNQLNIPKEERDFMHLSQKFALQPGRKILPPHIIFPKIDTTE